MIVVIGAFFDIQGEAFGGRHATKRRRGGDVTRGGHAGACPPKTGQFTAIHSESLRGKALPYRGGGIGGRGHEKSKIAKRTQFGSSRRGKVGKAKPITKPNCGRRYDGAAFALPASLWRVCRTRQRRLVGLGSGGNSLPRGAKDGIWERFRRVCRGVLMQVNWRRDLWNRLQVPPDYLKERTFRVGFELGQFLKRRNGKNQETSPQQLPYSP